MRYYCTSCGQFAEEEDLDTYQECVGEFWGSPAYETYSICPNCGSEEILPEDELEEEDE